jgi:hypothetical protein
VTKLHSVQLSAFPEIQPDKPVGPILPSVFTGTNADLMAAVAPFYLAGSVCDLTYGEGKWWDRFRPDPFVAHDKFKLDGVDFTDLPEPDNTYDAVRYDPPYVISGTASSVRLGPDFQNRYGIGLRNIGLGGRKGDSSAFEEMIAAGVAEAVRVSRGWVLVKCMEFSQGGHVQPWRSFHDIPHLVTCTALALGCFKHDQIVHHTGAGPGGHNIFDPKRARRHHSYLLVYRKPVEARSERDLSEEGQVTP